MATIGQISTETFVAAGDIDKLTFVKPHASERGVVACTDGDAAIGVALLTVESGEPLGVVTDGRVKVIAGGNITAGANVASDANGHAVAAASTDIILGTAMEAGADNQVITIQFYQGGNAA